MSKRMGDEAWEKPPPYVLSFYHSYDDRRHYPLFWTELGDRKPHHLRGPDAAKLERDIPEASPQWCTLPCICGELLKLT